MVFFGGGKWRRQAEELSAELARIRASLQDREDENQRLKKECEDREASAKNAREGRKKAEKKVEKLTQSRQAADQKISAQQSRLERLQRELDEYKTGMHKAREEAEKAHARVARLEKSVGTETLPQPSKTSEAAVSPVPDAPASVEPSPRKIDRRLERLEEQLSEERNTRSELKDRIVRAEKNARDAERRRVAAANKAEAVVRDLQHSLRSERRAYKILQLQYEAQLDQVRDLRQSIKPSPLAPPVFPEGETPTSADAMASPKADDEDSEDLADAVTAEGNTTTETASKENEHPDADADAETAHASPTNDSALDAGGESDKEDLAGVSEKS